MKLDAAEKEVLDSVERGEWRPARAPKRAKGRYSGYAKATFRKDRRLNIRISTKDLEAIQKRALEEGLPYQTLIARLLHEHGPEDHPFDAHLQCVRILSHRVRRGNENRSAGDLFAGRQAQDLRGLFSFSPPSTGGRRTGSSCRLLQPQDLFRFLDGRTPRGTAEEKTGRRCR